MRKLLSVLSCTLQGGVRRGLLLLLLVASVSVIYASDTQVDGIWYDFDSSTKTASVTYRGSASDSYEAGYSGSVVIPETVTYNGTTYSVTSIGPAAFQNCSSLTSVTIPNSVTSVGHVAFWGCESLTSVTIPNSVTSIRNFAFYGCTSLPVENNLRYADTYLVEAVDKTLSTYSIKEGTKWIGDDAFLGCYSLTSVTIPNSVTSIGDYAFEGCSSLTSMTIPNSVTSIGDRAFYYCSSLTSVTIGESVTSIGDYAFYDCSSLTSVTINSDAIVSKDYPFDSNISDIFGSQVTEYIIGDDVKGIGDRAFYYCSSLTSVTIPNSVTSIGDVAFYYCSKLTSVTIPNSVTSIGDATFSGCSSLTSVTIPNSVTSVGYAAFQNCSSLTSVTIPNSVTSIGDHAFEGCSSLTSMTIPNSVTSIGDYAFYYCSSLTSVTIPNSVTSIGIYVFAYCFSLTSVTIPESVTSIGDSAFDGCSSLTSVTIGESVTSIGRFAFDECSSLTSITCEAETPPTVGSEAFYKVSKSIPVYVPCGCVEAYKTASSWKNFTNIQEPLVKYSIEVNVNDTIMGSAKVDWNRACDTQISATPNFGYQFVQWNDGNTDAIRTLELTHDTILTAEFAQSFSGQCGDDLYWSYDETAKTISITGSGEMYDYTIENQPWALFREDITEVYIDNSVSSIGTSAFNKCKNLGKLSIGGAMNQIAENAFANCSRLYEIECYAVMPPVSDISSFINYNAFVTVLCDSKRPYEADMVWGNFKNIECIASDEVPTNDVVINPGTTDVTITWPTEGNADTYTIVIKKDGEVVCTLTFNAEGQLLNIAFAPGRDGNHPVQYAEAVANGKGFRFTVTGLEEGTDYIYDIVVKNEANQVIETHSGKFTTESLTAVYDVEVSENNNAQKIIRDNQLLILRDGVEYNAMGQKIGN